MLVCDGKQGGIGEREGKGRYVENDQHCSFDKSI